MECLELSLISIDSNKEPVLLCCHPALIKNLLTILSNNMINIVKLFMKTKTI